MRQFGKRFCDMVLRPLVLTAALVVALLQSVDSSADTSQKRKKVAVVLSGGGAKGMAHIGVLHVLERAGIPVDIVTGTSMGSIVGGLYSIGYSASQLDSMVRVQDWTFLLSDKEEAHSQLLYNRKWQNTYMLSKTITLKNKKVTSEHGGFIEGRNLRNLFQNMAQGYNDSIDFNLLPIPFACVATDIITNTEYVFHSGVLAEAMRSSMAIPGVFSPIRKGEMVLVDGGLRNNFPVDVALAMGADVVIGVTVQGAPKTAADMKTTADVLSQIVDVNCKNKYDDNLKKTDVAIRVNTKGYSSAAFNAAAIDTLIRRGEEAAMAKWDELLALRKMIGIDTTFILRQNTDTLRMYPKLGARHNSVNDSVKHYSYEMKSEAVAAATTKHPSIFLAALGVRFDTEEIVALQLNGTLSPKNSPWNFGTTLRLGKRIMARGDIVYKPLKSGSMRFSYIFRHNDMNIYEAGSRTYNVTYNQHTVDLAPMNFNIRNFALAIGARFDYYAYNELLSSGNEQATNLPVRDEHLVSYYATLSYNSENKWLFPTRGACLDAHFRYNTDNFVNYGDNRGFSELSASWRMAFPLSSRFTLQPMLYGRLLFGGDIPICRSNMMGGNTFAHYVEQQVPFMGVGNIEFADNTLLAIQLLAYQRIADNNYVSLGFSTLRNCEKLSQTFDSSPRYGAQLGYTYTSLFGPLGAQLGWSNLTHSPYFYINLGFDF